MTHTLSLILWMATAQGTAAGAAAGWPAVSTWEPKEAFIRTPSYWRDPPVPVAVRSSPERIRPGETARIAVVFDLQDLRLDEPYATLTLLRDGKLEMESELQIAYFQGAAISGGDQ